MNVRGLYSWICVDFWRDGTSVRLIRFHCTRLYSQCTSLAITVGVIWSLLWIKVWTLGKTRPFNGHLLIDLSDLARYDRFRIDKNFFADCFDRWRQENLFELTISRSTCNTWSFKNPIEILELMKKGHLFVSHGKTTYFWFTCTHMNTYKIYWFWRLSLI